ncbi:MAG: hypothetical protein HFG49_16320 [Lachnospiraceae bacterium]|nr:hypothetical protein [Lachnospiraceae bacterium]
MSGFYENYVKLMGNLIEPDRATPYKINYLKKIIKNDKVLKLPIPVGVLNLEKSIL